mgnify:CR=1 FL=1
MLGPIKKAKKKVEVFFALMNYPHGVDEKYDEECDSAFHKFLDGLYYFLVCSFVLFGSVSMYFFITYELLGDK